MKTLDYKTLFEISQRVNWRLDDIVGGDKRFDFSKAFLPETFARTDALTFLSAAERLTVNHIRARGYLALFHLVEEFVEPFVTQEAEAGEHADPHRAKALLQFAHEERKHMEMFRRVLREFDAAFGTACGVIGPAEDIRRAVLGHTPLAVTLMTLALEWMSQAHFVESIKDDVGLDPQFKSLLKHHWVEECQHARLDGLMIGEMSEGLGASEIDAGIEGYLDIVTFFDGGFLEQTKLDMDAFGRATGRKLSDTERERFLRIQHQAMRWTFLGSAMTNANFLAVLGTIRSDIPARIRMAAAAYC